MTRRSKIYELTAERAETLRRLRAVDQEIARIERFTPRVDVARDAVPPPSAPASAKRRPARPGRRKGTPDA